MEDSKDQLIKCSDCGRDFTFTEGEQLYYKDRELNPPKRCPSCRAEKRRQRNENQGKSYR